MASALDILGSLLQGGMKKSTATRIEHSLGESGVGGSGGILDQILGGAKPSTTPPPPQAGAKSSGGTLGDMVGSILGNTGALKAGGLGAIAGALLGGGSKSMKGGIGGGALALLGTLALQAFRNASGKPKETLQLDAATKLAAGLRTPDNEREQEEVQAVAELIVKAMVNAAKADGRIDEGELKRITGNLEKDGISAREQELLDAELREPMATDSLVRAVPNPQVAAQVYAASLLAVELDTDAERQYLAELAGKLRLDANVVRHLHSAVGVA